MTRVLVLGMSHTYALKAALKKSEKASFEIVDLQHAPDIFDRTDRKNPVLKLDMRDWTSPDVVCLSIGGNLHNWFSLLENPKKFRLGDAVLGSVPPAASHHPDRYFVPRDLLRSSFLQRLEETRILTERIQAHFAQARFIQLCAPPPIKDRPSPNAVPSSPAADSLALGRDGTDRNKIIHIMAFDAAPPQLRMKVLEVQTDIYAAHAQTLGALFLPPPPEALTPDGFLDRPYWDADPTHGNAAYGRLVLKQIRTAAGIPREARPDVKRAFPIDRLAQ